LFGSWLALRGLRSLLVPCRVGGHAQHSRAGCPMLLRRPPTGTMLL
jgi:hypothetical protein